MKNSQLRTLYKTPPVFNICLPKQNKLDYVDAFCASYVECADKDATIQQLSHQLRRLRGCLDAIEDLGEEEDEENNATKR